MRGSTRATDTVELTVTTLSSHLVARKFDYSAVSSRTPYCRVSSPTSNPAPKPPNSGGSFEGVYRGSTGGPQGVHRGSTGGPQG
eukprot:3990835-Pyramimonas_sp.AAC.2